MTAEEQRIDQAMRKEHRSHAQQDAALSAFRLAHLRSDKRESMLERTADLMLGVQS
ncbi:hypothetical protein GCM10008098_11850 [Rhodanobacter panaciterrae]|uniref:Uncharacterized protein n=1 Tax=Rhodanobacter panaciterrae TaxID=490572 RepID=A0ABQ2ZMV2_9GAMM|nr:hypothetical protein [Rhodanobacter panaciterrae]GGY20825.1 hypothetical protein GCM10008098_11850 [Rhodanobacter panaciterrae]